MNFIENFNYRITGADSSPKLVFLHGLMGFASNWRSIAKAFEKDFQILCYDQRGHGKSFKPDSNYAPEDYAEDLNKILEDLGWTDIVLVGHSMGARNATSFAYKYGKKLKALVLEDLGPEANLDSIAKNKLLLSRVPTPFNDKKEARSHIEAEFKDNMILGEYLYANLHENEQKQIDWRFSKNAILLSVEQGRSTDRWEQFLALDMPTLLIRGAKSDEFPADIYQSMLNRNPRVKGVEIPGAGHWVHFDSRDQFISVLKDFFCELQLMEA
jgi:pimeloyl-ACP methyl ester carboxylesterase